MTESRPGSSSDPTDAYRDPYQAYPDPAYAGSAPLGPSYSATSMPSYPAPTEPLPQYWTQTSPHTGQLPSPGDQPPEPPRPPRPWLWAASGFALAVVLGLVVWLVFVVTNPSRQQTSIPAMPTTTTPRTTPTPTPSFTIPNLPFPIPNLPFPTAPTTTTGPNTGETEPVDYEVTGTGRAINITYIDTGGLMQTEFNVLLPWHKEVNLTKPAKTAASITVINAGRDITCKISIQGVQVEERTGALLTVCRPSG
ncbi:MAG: hypothetical protein JO191_03440 [Mycobacteriaceae bacterium]|nr:hypothetical protein [Mycobacteriaceae bacterium]